MKHFIVYLILTSVIMYQGLQLYKTNLLNNRLNELYIRSVKINDDKRELYSKVYTQYLKWESKYKAMREQNYILSRKFRKTDTPEYRKKLSKMIREASGIGGQKSD